MPKLHQDSQTHPEWYFMVRKGHSPRFYCHSFESLEIHNHLTPPQKSSKPVTGQRSQFCISNKFTGDVTLSTNHTFSSNVLNQGQNTEKVLEQDS